MILPLHTPKGLPGNKNGWYFYGVKHRYYGPADGNSWYLKGQPAK